MAVDSFPRRAARTRNFTLGAPRSFQVAADGSRVAFLRSPAGDDPRNGLWVFDVAEGRERLVLAAEDLGSGDLSVQEQARRERVRETSEGIVSYATDRLVKLAAVGHAGRLSVVDLVGGTVRELEVPEQVYDPRPDPSGRSVAFVCDRALHVVDVADGDVRRLAADPDPAVGWGVAEFIAAEEMGRFRGFWWAPDGTALLAARVDERPVRELWIADPADPGAQPRAVRYPTAGSDNADVQAFVIALDRAAPVEISWDRRVFPYLAAADWDELGPMIVVQARDQRRVEVLAVDPQTGDTEQLGAESDPIWVDLIDGVPRRLDGRLVTVGGSDDTVALMVDSEPVTPAGLEVRAVLAVDAGAVLFTASTEPTELHVWRWTPADGLTQLTHEPGVHTAVAGGGLCVLGSRTLQTDGARWTVGGHRLASHAERPEVRPAVKLLRSGPRKLRVGVLMPAERDPAVALPVLLDPYAGPHFQRVVAVRNMWLQSQWLADQGFAVVVADGRGTPGRGRAWARAVHGDLATAVLDDQIEALHGAADQVDGLDLERVAIRGWSFGGYLAALAVLRRPDVFAAAVAGAPVTDWRLYDTHYTERYLGTEPDGADADAYERSSLLADAHALRRPLLLIHGLADDNVIAAHTLQLSQRLTESGRRHSVLPLTGITHMTPQEAVAENLLTLQVQFLREALGGPSQAPVVR